MKEVLARREKVLFDVVLKNGDRVAELLPHLSAQGFARLWNRLPRPRPERATVQPVRWVDDTATD